LGKHCHPADAPGCGYADTTSFGELGEDVAACATTIMEQGSEDIFTIATVAAMKKLVDKAALQKLGTISEVLDW